LPHVPNGGYTGMQLGVTYKLPHSTAKPGTVYLIELGGGYSASAIAAWCNSFSVIMPNLSFQSIDGATNDYTGDPSSADVEVELDICVVAGIIAYCFGQAANIVVVFAPNTANGFLHAVQYCAQQRGNTGISWGGPEDTYGNLSAMESAFASGPGGMRFCAASGDNGPDDGESKPVTDYPACSAYVLSCGATTLAVDPTFNRISETPWNAGGGASGGGFSKIVRKPSWQTGVPGSYRGAPDLCACGDPATGWSTPFGIIGGTSAVAPMYAAVGCVLDAMGVPAGLLNPSVYRFASTFFDVISGSIGPGFPAGPGWDTASGVGSINGAAFAAALLGGPTGPGPGPTGPTGTPPGPTGPPAGSFHVAFPRPVPAGGLVLFRSPVTIQHGLDCIPSATKSTAGAASIGQDITHGTVS
jgi:kumamolisin